MRIALVSDIHGNLEAFTAVLSRIDAMNVDAVCCLGDIVGYGPFPDECVDMVKARCALTVRGNHDAGMCGSLSLDHFDPPGKKALQKTRNLLKPENLAYLAALPLVARTGEITLAHSSPYRPEAWTYLHTHEDARAAFRSFTGTLCFIGHTHVPAVIAEDLMPGPFRGGIRMLINVGSVGQPRDGEPAAAFGLLDVERWTYDLIRVEYDVGKTIEALRKGGYPAILAERLGKGW